MSAGLASSLTSPLALPLTGVRVIEFEGIGPGPLAGRMLADLGTEVTVIARLQQGAVAAQLGGGGENPMQRGKTVVQMDLKQDSAPGSDSASGDLRLLCKALRPGCVSSMPNVAPYDGAHEL